MFRMLFQHCGAGHLPSHSLSRVTQNESSLNYNSVRMDMQLYEHACRRLSLKMSCSTGILSRSHLLMLRQGYPWLCKRMKQLVMLEIRNYKPQIRAT